MSATIKIAIKPPSPAPIFAPVLPQINPMINPIAGNIINVSNRDGSSIDLTTIEFKIITPIPIKKPQNAPTKTEPPFPPITAPTIMHNPKITKDILNIV